MGDFGVMTVIFATFLVPVIPFLHTLEAQFYQSVLSQKSANLL